MNQQLFHTPQAKLSLIGSEYGCSRCPVKQRDSDTIILSRYKGDQSLQKRHKAVEIRLSKIR